MTVNAILDAFARRGDVASCRALVAALEPGFNLRPDSVTLSTLAKACIVARE